jgi:predicted membrane-bound spermidine synthase
MKSNLRVVFALVMACFFVSGVAGLVYQIAWARYLSLFLGHTSYAVIAVLVAFMGGLAIGNAVIGVWADRAERPLALYGWLEIGIAIYAALFPSYYELCHNLYIAAARQIGGNGGAPLLLLKFAFSFITILLPATLMGATFPTLTRFVTRSLAELRERVALLYFINSLGAVFGCWAADFYWIPRLGLELTVFAAAALNLAAGLIALGISRAILEGSPTSVAAPESNANVSDEYFSALDLKIATIAIGCSGFVAMLYEVAWTRLLALALGSSTHAYSIMLMTFIAGIAVGAILIARWKTLRRTLDAFGWAESALAVTALLSMFTYELLPYWFAQMAMLLARRPEAYPLFEAAQALICFAVMFIPAVCLGTTLPLASRIATAELARTGRSVGKIFAVNTVGTVLGAIVTGLWLMPSLGLAATFATGIVLNAGVGAAILFRARLVRVQAVLIASAVAAAVVFVWGASGLFESSWEQAFTQGVWRQRSSLGSIKQFRDAGKAFRLDYYKDGAGATVAVHHQADNPRYLALRVNGKIDASSGDEGTQLMLGHLPCLLNTKATNALVVGLGSGMTSGAILRHTNIVGVQVVEISPEVFEAAHLFTNYNDNVFANPRFHVRIEDAKSFLKTTEQKFDFIVSEPSNPWMAGVAAVFSLEYYQNCAERLAKDGTMVQWVQVYETSDRTFQTVVKTFSAVFPFVSIWRSQTGDVLLVGAVEPRPVDVDAFVARMRVPRISRDMARGGFSEPLALLSREIISPSNGAFLARPADVVHSDYYPILDYMAQIGFFVGNSAGIQEVYDETKSTRAQTLLGEYLRNHKITPEDFKLSAQAAVDLQFADAALTYSLMQRWAQSLTNSTLPLEMIERLLPTRPSALTEELRLLPRHAWLIEQGKVDIAALHFYERVLMRAYRTKRSVFYVPDSGPLQEALGVLMDRDPKNRRIFNLHLAELAWDQGDDVVALRYGLAGLDPDTKKSGPYLFTLDELAPRQVLADLIETALRSGKVKQAQALADLARAGKLLREGEFFFAPLDLACRKAAVATEAAATGGAK